MQNRIHQNRLASAKASLDTTVSPAVMNARIEDKGRKREINKAKEEELIRKNNILLKKLSEISHRPHSESSTIIHDRHALNRNFVLQREHVRKQNEIAFKNRKMLARIEAQTSKVESALFEKRGLSASSSRNRTPMSRSHFANTSQKSSSSRIQRSGFRISGNSFDGGFPPYSKKGEMQNLMELEQNRGDEEAQGLYFQRLKAWRANAAAANSLAGAPERRDQSSLSLLVRAAESDLKSHKEPTGGRKSRGRIFGYQPEPVGRPVPVRGSELLSESELGTFRTAKVSFFQKLSK